MNHISSGSSGSRVTVPDPSRSIACFTRRIVVIVVVTGETAGMRVTEGLSCWAKTGTTCTNYWRR